MAPAHLPPTGARPTAGKAATGKHTVAGWVTTVIVVLVCCGAGAVGLAGSRDDDTTVPVPTQTERAETVALLKQASDAQGVCYGWRLTSLGDDVSVGSNLGDGVAVTENPSCPRWVEVVASVTYTSSNSELEDWATVRVASSDDIRGDRIGNRLDRFELDEKAFLDEPGWAICRAATVLPLLTAETGAVGPVPVATGAATLQPGATLPDLPDAGNDLLRDRWGLLLTAGGLLLVTALLITVGLVQRGRQRR